MKEFEKMVKPGERLIGRKAIALNGAEIEKAIWAGVEEGLRRLQANRGQKEDLERELERELSRLTELGKVHLSFPRIHWKISIGLESNRENLWAEVEIGLSEVRKWKGQVGEIDRRKKFEEIQQEQDNVPDRIRERWGLGVWLEVRTVDGRIERRETIREVKEGKEIEDKRDEENEIEKRDKVSEPVPMRIDKADLLAEPIDEKVAQPIEPVKESKGLGVSMRRRGMEKGK